MSSMTTVRITFGPVGGGGAAADHEVAISAVAVCNANLPAPGARMRMFYWPI